MRGIEYLVDDSGKPKAVVIDLELHEELWEDFADQLTVRERQSEPRESLDEVKRSLRSLDEAAPAGDYSRLSRRAATTTSSALGRKSSSRGGE